MTDQESLIAGYRVDQIKIVIALLKNQGGEDGVEKFLDGTLKLSVLSYKKCTSCNKKDLVRYRADPLNRTGGTYSF